MKKIAVLVSGGGTNLQALLDAQHSGILTAGKITLIVSTRKDAFALQRAQKAGLATLVLSPAAFPSSQEYNTALVKTLLAHNVSLVVLAGFLTILGPAMLAAFPGRIVNVHPSLLPAFGGKGMYGLRIHQAALQRGVKITGATVHLVNEKPDGGEILLQQAVAVLQGDTPETLQKRVMEQAEWVLLPNAVQALCQNLP